MDYVLWLFSKGTGLFQGQQEQPTGEPTEPRAAGKPVMAEECGRYPFPYEVGSKQVRQYRVNDVGTFYMAIAINVQEYLASFVDVEEEERFSTMEMTASGVAVAAVVAAHIYAASLPTAVIYLVYGFFAVVCGMITLKDGILTGNDTVFVSAGGERPRKGSDDPAEDHEARADVWPSSGRLVPKYVSDLLTTHRVSIHLEGKPFSPDLKLVACLVGPRRFLAPPKRLMSVSHEFSYTQYFSKDGRIFPPRIIEDVDRLLNRLLAETKKVPVGGRADVRVPTTRSRRR